MLKKLNLSNPKLLNCQCIYIFFYLTWISASILTNITALTFSLEKHSLHQHGTLWTGNQPIRLQQFLGNRHKGKAIIIFFFFLRNALEHICVIWGHLLAWDTFTYGSTQPQISTPRDCLTVQLCSVCRRQMVWRLCWIFISIRVFPNLSVSVL